MTSFRAEDDVKKTLDMKKQSNTKIINKAIKLYLNEFGLEEKLSELDFEIEKLKKKRKEFKRIKENMDKEVEEKKELEDRDIIEELIQNMKPANSSDRVWRGTETELDKIKDNTKVLKYQAKELGISKDELKNMINRRLENGSSR